MSQVNDLYKDIQDLLYKLVPEKFRRLYLYASIINGKNGEMFFYYFPRTLLKSNAVNCYDVPDKFGIDENSYNENLNSLFNLIRRLYVIQKGAWTNITIKFEGRIFTVEYHFNDLVNSNYSDSERRIIWCSKYLNIPEEKFSKAERKLIESYVEESKRKHIVYTEELENSSIFEDEEDDEEE